MKLIEAANEIEQMQEIVDGLPRTADGVPLVLGKNYWTWIGTHLCQCSMFMITPMLCGYDRFLFPPSAWYSTRESAEKARQQ